MAIGAMATNSDKAKATTSIANVPDNHFAAVRIAVRLSLRLKTHSIPVSGRARYTIPIKELATMPATIAASSGAMLSAEKVVEDACKMPISGYSAYFIPVLAVSWVEI
jgi:hypothetical protein